MEEETKDIKEYEGLYCITRSGRIFSLRKNKFLERNGDQYGFHNVHLSKKGERTLYKTLRLWDEAFGMDADKTEYKGM